MNSSSADLGKVCWEYPESWAEMPFFLAGRGVFYVFYKILEGFPGGSDRSGRSPGEGNGNQLQYTCLENSMDEGAW